MKNAYRASTHALILTHPYIHLCFLKDHTTLYVAKAFESQDAFVLFSLPNSGYKPKFSALQRCIGMRLWMNLCLGVAIFFYLYFS